jgi:hypothetical protein
MKLPFFLAAAFALATPAMAMDFDCPAPGTTIEFDSGVKIVAKSKDGNDCLMERDGKPFRIRALMLDNPGADGTDTTALIASLRPERLFPLAVGKKIEARHSSSQGSWNYVLTVTSAPQMQGPGGALYDTFLVEMTEAATSGPYRSISRYWIAPKARYLLRYDFSDSDNRFNRALVTKISN